MTVQSKPVPKPEHAWDELNPQLVAYQTQLDVDAAVMRGLGQLMADEPRVPRVMAPPPDVLSELDALRGAGGTGQEQGTPRRLELDLELELELQLPSAEPNLAGMAELRTLEGLMEELAPVETEQGPRGISTGDDESGPATGSGDTGEGLETKSKGGHAPATRSPWTRIGDMTSRAKLTIHRDSGPCCTP